jgi:hypothetical protein
VVEHDASTATARTTMSFRMLLTARQPGYYATTRSLRDNPAQGSGPHWAGQSLNASGSAAHEPGGSGLTQRIELHWQVR